MVVCVVNVFNPFTAMMPFDLKMTNKKVKFEIHKPYFLLILAYICQNAQD